MVLVDMVDSWHVVAVVTISRHVGLYRCNDRCKSVEMASFQRQLVVYRLVVPVVDHTWSLVFHLSSARVRLQCGLNEVVPVPLVW